MPFTVSEIAELICTRPKDRPALVERIRHWTREGLIRPLGDKNPGTGRHRVYGKFTVTEVALLNIVADLGMPVSTQREILYRYRKTVQLAASYKDLSATDVAKAFDAEILAVETMYTKEKLLAKLEVQSVEAEKALSELERAAEWLHENQDFIDKTPRIKSRLMRSVSSLTTILSRNAKNQQHKIKLQLGEDVSLDINLDRISWTPSRRKRLTHGKRSKT